MNSKTNIKPTFGEHQALPSATASSANLDMRTLSRAMDILQAITPYSEGLTQHEIIEIVHLPRTTVRRFLMVLQEKGLIILNITTQKYTLDYSQALNRSLFPLAFEYVQTKKFMNNFFVEHHIPLLLYSRSRNDIFLLDCSDNSQHLSRYLTQNLCVPLGVTLPSFGILACLSQNEVDSILEVNRDYIESMKYHSVDFVYDSINKIRKNGYVYGQGTMFPQYAYAVFPIILKNACPAALCAKVERKEDYAASLDKIIKHIKSFVLK